MNHHSRDYRSKWHAWCDSLQFGRDWLFILFYFVFSPPQISCLALQNFTAILRFVIPSDLVYIVLIAFFFN
jgi:hypothetical protein